MNRMRIRWLLATLALLAPACGGGDTGAGIRLDLETTVEFEPGAEPVALGAVDDGGLLVGERRTGAVRRIDAGGDLSEPVAQVSVRAGADDQRGLLGLATDGDRVFAAWIRGSDGRLVVAELVGGTERLLWEGPVAADQANDGHLARHPDGRLIIGVGDLLQPDLVDDPHAPNGKLLALDPDGPPDQVPEVLSGGWNNPFAFVVTGDGAIWVADNAPGDDPERIGRGDRAAPRTDLPGMRAPSALVELEPRRLGMCGYLDDTLTVVEIDDDRVEVGEAATTGCRSGAVSLGEDRIAVSDGERVRVIVRR